MKCVIMAFWLLRRRKAIQWNFLPSKMKLYLLVLALCILIWRNGEHRFCYTSGSCILCASPDHKDLKLRENPSVFLFLLQTSLLDHLLEIIFKPSLEYILAYLLSPTHLVSPRQRFVEH